MEHIPLSSAEKFEKGVVTSWEYVTPSELMNVALIRIDGRYPDSGYTINRVVDSIVQVTEGEGVLGVADGSTVRLSKYDQVHIQKDEAYYFEGNLEIIYAATPKWTPEQTTQVD